MSSVKQVIVIRKDLKCRRGKEIAQGAHASLAVILNEMQETIFLVKQTLSDYRDSKMLFMDPVLSQWVDGSFAKICLVVDSEEELLNIYEQAKVAKLRTVLITDSGKTEFNGVPTNTVVAIGPNYAEDIDKITGELKLY
jgi:PTH2 family peptidyl-tRNA hydrolase